MDRSIATIALIAVTIGSFMITTGLNGCDPDPPATPTPTFPDDPAEGYWSWRILAGRFETQDEAEEFARIFVGMLKWEAVLVFEPEPDQ